MPRHGLPFKTNLTKISAIRLSPCTFKEFQERQFEVFSSYHSLTAVKSALKPLSHEIQDFEIQTIRAFAMNHHNVPF